MAALVAPARRQSSKRRASLIGGQSNSPVAIACALGHIAAIGAAALVTRMRV